MNHGQLFTLKTKFYLQIATKSRLLHFTLVDLLILGDTEENCWSSSQMLKCCVPFGVYWDCLRYALQLSVFKQCSHYTSWKLLSNNASMQSIFESLCLNYDNWFAASQFCESLVDIEFISWPHDWLKSLKVLLLIYENFS